MEQPDEVIFKLQQLFIVSEIEKELEDRNINKPGLPQRLVEIAKLIQNQHDTSSDPHNNPQQQFISKAQLEISGGTVLSKYFLSSLHTRIRQNLPRNLIHILEQADKEQQVRQEEQSEKYFQIEQDPNGKEDKQIEERNDKQMQFPGLSIPDKNYKDDDEIELDLDLGEDEQKKPNQEIQKVSRQKSKSPEKEEKMYRDNSSDQDSQREKKRHKKEKKKKEKKDKSKKKQHKKHKKRRHSESESEDSERSRSRSRKKKSRKEQEEEILKIEEGKIFRGRVTKIDKFGCFVKLIGKYEVGVQDKGLVHVSEMHDKYVSQPSDIVEENQKVYVKVLTINNGRLRLSMKGINQQTGQLLFNFDSQIAKYQKPTKKIQGPNSIGQLTGIKIEDIDEVNFEGNGTQYAEAWEVNRLSYMGGIVKPRGIIRQDIEEINIQMNQKQPPFLRGQTTKAGINLSPVKLVKNPEGTLQRQALNAAQYARQRRQIREMQNKTQSRDLSGILDEITPTETQRHSLNKCNKSGSSKSILINQRTRLPIYQYKQQLIKACIDNKVLIVIGQTGSGKTTQITQYLHERGFSKHGKIGCTQPRRVAAISVAKRVCEQMGVKLGEEVGYSIRFQDVTSNKTLIKYMTDGMLLREALIDKYLSGYSVIMLDEAHERTIHTDVLFGILKKVVQKRNDFTLIVTSATLEAKKFSSYFFDCKIFSIPGRTYNVQILYAKEPQTDYLDASLMCVMQIHLDEPSGDILLFLTGQEQIDSACQILKQRLRKMGNQIPELIILPVYSALPSQLQTKIFEPAPKGKRKCVIATNIAEASLTIDGIYYVVDPGFAKIKIYNSKLGMDSLIVAPISQASAKQRAGRAGRTGPGKCYRIYTEQAYQSQMLPTSIPQIQRANLSNTVLELKAMGINDLINFDFMDAPPVQTLIAALQQLYYLSALDDQGLLTKVGRKMAQFPLEPPLSKMLLTSIDFGCTHEIVTIIAMLSIPNIFYRPKEKQTIADQKKTKFNHMQGDHLTLLSVYEGWRKNNYSSSWCQQNFIQYRGLKRAQDIRNQILQLLQRYKFPINSCGSNGNLIRKTIVSGFFFHAAKKDSKGGYRTLVDDHVVYIHPSSALFNKQPEWVVYHELIFTTKEYMRNVCSINPKWLIDVAPNFFKFTDELGFQRKKRGQVLAPLIQKYGDPNAWRLSKRKG